MISRRARVLLLSTAWMLAALAPLTAHAARAPTKEMLHDVSELDLEELMDVQVTTSARKAQAVTDVPAAITVLTGEDLQRMGVTSLAEALRAVPGMMVARVHANTWAVTARGLGDTLANKMLVMIDGRTVYSPLHSGVFWDVQGIFLEDVDRIEVIRGPGGSLWGANAVNGIVNVITKSADDTQGALVAGALGSETGLARFHYGFPAGDNGRVRIHAQHDDIGDAVSGIDDDKAANDGLSMTRGGFRADWKVAGRDSLTLMGDAYDGKGGESIAVPLLVPPFVTTHDDPVDLRGGDLIFRWNRDLGGTSSLTFQGGLDSTFRSDAVSRDSLHAFDLDFQHRCSPGAGHDFIWGMGYRLYRSDFDGTFVFQMMPERHSDDVASAFVQDEIPLASGRVKLTLGSKFEVNDYSGFEAQPSARLAWRPGPRHMAWFAVSRAVRTPSIIDVDGRLTPVVLPSDPPVAVSILGNDDFKTEELVAWEAGYRVHPVERFSLDLSVFRNGYHRLRSGGVGTPFVETDPAPLHVVVPVDLGNALHGETRGAELAMNWQPVERWLLQANASILRPDLSEKDINRRDPRSAQWLRSSVDLPSNFSLDLMLRHVAALRFFDIDGYMEADARLAWHAPHRDVELAVVGQNLLRDSHPEYEVPAKRSEIERACTLSLTWRF